MQVAKPQETEPDPPEEEGVLLPRPKLANSSAEEKTSCLFFRLLPLLGNQEISQGLLSPLRGEDWKLNYKKWKWFWAPHMPAQHIPG